VIARFRREADENHALLGYYAVSSGNFLPTFRDIFRVQDLTLKTEPIALYRIYFRVCHALYTKPKHIASNNVRTTAWQSCDWRCLEFSYPACTSQRDAPYQGLTFSEPSEVPVLHITCVQRQ